MRASEEAIENHPASRTRLASQERPDRLIHMGAKRTKGAASQMLSHTCIGVNDFDRAFAFYSAVMASLGHELKFRELDRPWAGWMAKHRPRPLFIIGRPYDGNPAQSGNGQMVAFLAPDRAGVDRVYATALANGATSEGEPGLRPHYHPDYYGAYFRDPDGNKIGICCHEPEAG